MKKAYFVFVAAVTVVLAAGGIVTVAKGNREFSENENRYLTQFPEISLSGILSGDVQEDVTNAFNDQFLKRDFWISISTKVEKTLGYRDINGVYLGKDHYYFDKVMNQDISQTNYFQNLRFVNHIAGKGNDARVTALLVPSPGTVLKEKLPEHAVLYNADKMYQEAAQMLGKNSEAKTSGDTEADQEDLEERQTAMLDIRQQLEETGQDKQIYYRTDHHWSLRGAYVGYQAYTESMGREPESYDGFDVQIVSDAFYGTLYSKALDSEAVADEMDAPQNLPEVSVICDGKETGSVYDETKKEEKDKYAYFFGGNYGEVQIQNKEAGKKKLTRKLLIIKDSFANSMVPFLLQDYSEIRMLDMRYYKGSVQELLETYEADEILVLYEMSNFAQDGNLNKLVK